MKETFEEVIESSSKWKLEHQTKESTLSRQRQEYKKRASCSPLRKIRDKVQQQKQGVGERGNNTFSYYKRRHKSIKLKEKSE